MNELTRAHCFLSSSKGINERVGREGKVGSTLHAVSDAVGVPHAMSRAARRDRCSSSCHIEAQGVGMMQVGIETNLKIKSLRPAPHHERAQSVGSSRPIPILSALYIKDRFAPPQKLARCRSPLRDLPGRPSCPHVHSQPFYVMVVKSGYRYIRPSQKLDDLALSGTGRRATLDRAASPQRLTSQRTPLVCPKAHEHAHHGHRHYDKTCTLSFDA